MKKILFISAIMLLAVTACCKKTKVETYPFSGKTLQLVELGGEAYAPATTTRSVEVNFGADNRVAGNTGCNLFNGTFYVNADTLRFPQPMAMTRMMCDETSNQVERAMTQLLNETTRYTVDGDRISFYNADKLLAVFRVSAPAACCKGNADHKCSKGNADHKCCKGDSTKQCSKQALHKCHKDSAACAKQCTAKQKPQVCPKAPDAAETQTEVEK